MNNYKKIWLLFFFLVFSIQNMNAGNFFRLLPIHHLKPIIHQCLNQDWKFIKTQFLNISKEPVYCWIGLGCLWLWHIKSNWQMDKKYQNVLNQQNKHIDQITRDLNNQIEINSIRNIAINTLHNTVKLTSSTQKQFSINQEHHSIRIDRLEQKYNKLNPIDQIDLNHSEQTEVNNKPASNILNHIWSYFSPQQPPTSSVSPRLFSEQD